MCAFTYLINYPFLWLQVNSRRKYRRYWNCVIPDCAARLNTHHEFITKFVYHHNHELDAVDVRVGRIMETIYEEERCPIRPENFIKSEPDHHNITSSFPTFYACKSTLYRQRGKEIPKLPISPQNIVLEGKWTRTNAGDNFLVADDGEDSRIVIFGTDSNITTSPPATWMEHSTLYGTSSTNCIPSTEKATVGHIL